jgi:uncharacterized protein (TIGR00369 family)
MPNTDQLSTIQPDAPAAVAGLRSRHVTWTDPATVLQRVSCLSPKQMWEAFTSGALPRPPVSELIGFDLIEVKDGRAVMIFEAAEHTCSPMGIVAGGITATVMDAAMWIAVQSGLGDGLFAATTSVTVNFTRPVPADNRRLRVEASALHCGRTAAVAECTARDDSGNLYAQATSTLACTHAGWPTATD